MTYVAGGQSLVVNIGLMTEFAAACMYAGSVNQASETAPANSIILGSTGERETIFGRANFHPTLGAKTKARRGWDTQFTFRRIRCWTTKAP